MGSREVLQRQQGAARGRVAMEPAPAECWVPPWRQRPATRSWRTRPMGVAVGCRGCWPPRLS